MHLPLSSISLVLIEAENKSHWVAMISPKGWVAPLSWITGWVNSVGWIALTATGGLLGSQLVVGVIALENPNYESKSWHQFLIYVGYTLIAFFVNAFLNSTLDYVNKAAFFWSISGFVIICITILATSSPNYADGDFVFRFFINETGWPGKNVPSTHDVSGLLTLVDRKTALHGFWVCCKEV